MSQSVKVSKEILQIIEDIKSIKIQGATNVALATLDGLKKWISAYDVSGEISKTQIINELKEVGNFLAFARPNEPLAKNGVKFVSYNATVQGTKTQDNQDVVNIISQEVDTFVKLISDTKNLIVKCGVETLGGFNEILTHCHSSTAVKLLVEVDKRRGGDLKVVTTETRPRYQGRTTAKNLVTQGLDVTMVVDSAAASFTYDNRYFPVDAVVLGVDQINVDGSAINKVGSLGLALSAYMGNKPLYVACPLLKLDVSTVYNPIEIELRDAHEIWPEAPKGLTIINPAFELIPEQFITGYITEFGVLKPSEVQSRMVKEYEWVM